MKRVKILLVKLKSEPEAFIVALLNFLRLVGVGCCGFFFSVITALINAERNNIPL